MLDILIMILTVFVMIISWIAIYDSNRFVVETHVVEDERILKPCRAVVLADLHNKTYGKENVRLLEAIRAGEPDMILVAGDIPTAKKGARLDIALHLMKELAGQYPVYYGNGNHEHRMKLYPAIYKDMAQRYAEGLREIGIEPLVNMHVKLSGYGITIYGAEIDKTYYKRFRVKHMEGGYLEKLLGKPDTQSYCVLLAHNPDYFPQYAAWGADLTLAGHVHGGIVRIPFLKKGVASPAIRLFPKYDSGLFQEGGKSMFVSRGLGMHTIPIRLFNPAQLLVVDFVPLDKNSDTDPKERMF